MYAIEQEVEIGVIRRIGGHKGGLSFGEALQEFSGRACSGRFGIHIGDKLHLLRA